MFPKSFGRVKRGDLILASGYNDRTEALESLLKGRIAGSPSNSFASSAFRSTAQSAGLRLEVVMLVDAITPYGTGRAEVLYHDVYGKEWRSFGEHIEVTDVYGLSFQAWEVVLALQHGPSGMYLPVRADPMMAVVEITGDTPTAEGLWLGFAQVFFPEPLAWWDSPSDPSGPRSCPDGISSPYLSGHVGPQTISDPWPSAPSTWATASGISGPLPSWPSGERSGPLTTPEFDLYRVPDNRPGSVACWAYDINGATLTQGKRYLALDGGFHDCKKVFLVSEQSVSGGASVWFGPDALHEDTSETAPENLPGPVQGPTVSNVNAVLVETTDWEYGGESNGLYTDVTTDVGGLCGHINLHVASSINPGTISLVDQYLGQGVKTFDSVALASTIGAENVADPVFSGVGGPLVLTRRDGSNQELFVGGVFVYDQAGLPGLDNFAGLGYFSSDAAGLICYSINSATEVDYWIVNKQTAGGIPFMGGDDDVFFYGLGRVIAATRFGVGSGVTTPLYGQSVTLGYKKDDGTNGTLTFTGGILTDNT